MEELITNQLRPETALEAAYFGVAAGVGVSEGEQSHVEVFHIKHKDAENVTHDEAEFSRREVTQGPIVISKFMTEAVHKGLALIADGRVKTEKLPPETARILQQMLGRISLVEQPTVFAPDIPTDDDYYERYAHVSEPSPIMPMPDQLLEQRTTSIFIERRKDNQMPASLPSNEYPLAS